MSTTLDLLNHALRLIGAAGLGETPSAEDAELALTAFNLRGSNWNTRERFKKFERMQTFPVIASKQSYTIGPVAVAPDVDPDFIVTAGKRPVKLTHGNWINAGTAPQQSFPVEIIPVADYRTITYKEQTANYPYVLYYQTTNLNGTLWPVPYPTVIVDSLQLFWWDQFTKVDIADIALELNWPEGYDLAFALTLAEDLCLPFGKERTEQLREAASQARADYQSNTVPPPKLDTTGMMYPWWTS